MQYKNMQTTVVLAVVQLTNLLICIYKDECGSFEKQINNTKRLHFVP